MFRYAYLFETWARIELAYSSFAENRLTTWPPGLLLFELLHIQLEEGLYILAGFLSRVNRHIKEWYRMNTELLHHYFLELLALALEEVDCRVFAGHRQY